jgi:hypothetical protein
MSHEDGVDFQPEPSDHSEPSFAIEPPDVPPTEATVNWRWATAADMPALRVCHFQAEVEAGQELYLVADERPDREMSDGPPGDGLIPPGFTIPQGVECVRWDLKLGPLKTSRERANTRALRKREVGYYSKPMSRSLVVGFSGSAKLISAPRVQQR